MRIPRFCGRLAWLQPGGGCLEIVATPLTREGFAPFGELLAHRGDAPRLRIDAAAERVAPAEAPLLWIGRYDPAPGPVVIHPRLERHPFSAQVFVPLRVARYLLVVAPDGPDEGPDLGGLRAFVAGPGAGICYRRATWHAPMTVLDGPAEFMSSMWSAGGPSSDDAWFDLPRPLRVRIPASAAG